MKKIFISGHKGMVGSAIIRYLEENDKNREIITIPRDKLDLTNQNEVNKFIKSIKPDELIIAAAKVGGIYANNKYPAEFIYNNLIISSNLIHAAYETGIPKVLFLGSSCIYPRYATQPITENQLLSGSLEETNEWYAISKIAGIKLCQAYRKQYKCNFIICNAHQSLWN